MPWATCPYPLLPTITTENVSRHCQVFGEEWKQNYPGLRTTELDWQASSFSTKWWSLLLLFIRCRFPSKCGHFCWIHPCIHPTKCQALWGLTQVDKHVPDLRALTINRRDSVISRMRKLWGHGTGMSRQAFWKMMIKMSRSWLDKRDRGELQMQEDTAYSNARGQQSTRVRELLPVVPRSGQSPFFPYGKGVVEGNNIIDSSRFSSPTSISGNSVSFPPLYLKL